MGAALDSRRMRSLVLKITVAWVLACGCLTAADCGNDGPDGSDGGGGAGGSGGTNGGDASGGDTGAIGCTMIEAPTSCPNPPVTYGKVQPIFQARCANVCHNDRTIDPATDASIWGFPDYEHVKSWVDTIRPAVLLCQMPPPDAGVPITVEERRAILDWIRCGGPR